ncbi:hypothetical protein [Parvibaculum sp.]|jgi:hypothetical protein|uniref:hypothetical protein n=1 Tax=Parvibaculum sp. TaxID=2024848 RepID=UPI000C996D74|nr:hypothetical protein [Parvibaculum sp.]MAB13123.1 hypothetical protein [Parvibaculum sp.]
MQETTVIISNPILLVIIGIILVALLPVWLFLGIVAIWMAVGLFVGSFVYWFILFLTGMQLLALIAGVATTIFIWIGLFR